MTLRQAAGRFAAGIVFVLGTASGTQPAGAADAFYGGKQMRLIVSTPPGGIYDAFARLIAEHMPKHIPGQPKIIVQNMGGAAGLTAANYMYNTAPRDGTTFAGTHQSIPTAALLSPDGARYDPNKFGWIGSITKDPFIVYAWHTAPVKTLEDMFTKEFIVGGAGIGASSIDYAVIARDFFGLKLKIITGYSASPAVKLAMERGEIHGTFGNGWSDLKLQQPAWVKDGTVRILLQHGFTRHPELPEVPLFIDLAKTEVDRQALELLLARQEFSKPYFTPPEVPAERLAILRQAFEATVKDPAFLAVAGKAGLPVDSPMTGPELAAMTEKLSRTPPSVVKRIEAVFESFQAGK